MPIIFTLIKRFRKQITAITLLELLASVFPLALPLISLRIVDDGLIARDMHKFIVVTSVGAALFLTGVLFTTFESIVRNHYCIQLKLRLTKDFLRKLFAKDIAFFQTEATQEQFFSLLDVEDTINFIANTCPSFIVDCLKLVLIVIVALSIDARLTIVLILVSPLFLLKAAYFRKKLKVIYDSIWRYRAGMARRIYESLSRIYIIKSLGIERYIRNSYLKLLIKEIRLQRGSFQFEAIGKIISVFLSKMIYAAAAVYGGALVIKGRLSFGHYTAVMLYVTYMGSLVQGIADRVEFASQGVISVHRFYSLTMPQPALAPSRFGAIRKGIDIRNIRFSYRAGAPVADGISFFIPAASWIALVGPSGCGKTTIVNLLLKHYEPEEGAILIDGSDIRDMDTASLRKNMAVACQQPFLVCGTVRENILLEMKGIAEQELVQWCSIAGLHAYIASLPQGYDTLIGEEGAVFSSGLKQRVALARALIRRPHILILDEALSSLDSVNEHQILQALREKRKNSLTLVISHRLSTVIGADTIFFMQDGRHIVQGTHINLLSDDSYRRFFKEQMIREGAITDSMNGA
jgi:ABC-type bacteriocin/lantibiotic exporter with double-glycine peptidase domain